MTVAINLSVIVVFSCAAFALGCVTGAGLLGAYQKIRKGARAAARMWNQTAIGKQYGI